MSRSSKARGYRMAGGKRPSLVAKIRRENPYGGGWREKSKAIRARDGNRCTRCGATENLDVHHIIHVSKGGRDESCNLITLCRSCHARQPGHSHLRR